jgi:electron transfer flavoprotein beta subunit
MDIAVLLRTVPDPVEELELDDDETGLDLDYLGFVLNEFDDHALEEALLLKEDTGGSVTAYAIGTTEEVEQILHTAIAKGADAAVKLGDDVGALDAHAQAEIFSSAIGQQSHDVILCGVQASDEIDGQVAMLVAARLGHSHVSVVVATTPTEAGLSVTKEYWAGITATYDVTLPAVLGIQAARQAPRYVAVSRIRQAQESDALSEVTAEVPASTSGITITAMRIPEMGEGAEMIAGDETAAAERVLELLQAAGVGVGS